MGGESEGAAMSVLPDYRATAAALVRSIHSPSCSEDDAVALIANALGAEYAAGGLKAVEMVRSGLDDLRAAGIALGPRR